MLFKRLLVSYILISVVPLLVAAAVTSNITARMINEEIQRTTVQALDQAGKNISGIFDEAKNAIFSVSMNRELQSNLSRESASPFEINREITAIRNNLLYQGIFNDSYSSIEVYAINKKMYPMRHTQNDVMSAGIVEGQDWYRTTVHMGGKLYWRVSNDFGRPQISVSRLVFDVKNYTNPLAVVSVDIDLDVIKSILSGIRLGKTGRVFLLDNRGQTIYPIDENMTVPFNLLDATSGSDRVNLNGREMRVIYNTLPQTGWKLVGVVPVDELTRKADMARNIIYLIAIISLLVAVMMSVYFSCSISNPIMSLAGIMKKVENGDLNLSVSTPLKGEIAILYSSFNYMIKMINDLIQEVYVSRIKKKEAELKLFKPR
ncbi:cache domain-containing sensor histidine kinase [Thermosediminibacter oceani]|uniref:cache domain-containing sensor histidine kinase n=1 Tax=Thermosediminibacter oceani TaxID=291990 RepID=UPI0003196D5C|nr:cache domain-containing protein [Thermosediminibacter oceani]